MTALRDLSTLCLAAVALCVASRATAFTPGDACVSPYVIADGDVTSLRAAVVCANSDGVDSVIELATDGLYLFTDADPASTTRAVRGISANGLFTLLGHGATLQRDAASSALFGLLDVTAGATAELQDLTLAGGSVNAGSPGGGLRAQGTVRATSIRVVDNASGGRGGGIVVGAGASLVLSDSTVARNTSVDNGGGIRADGGSALWLVRSTVQANTVTGTGMGGGIQTQSVTRILNSTIIGNVVTGTTARGGGIAVDSGGDVTIVNATLMDNASNGDGEQLRRSGGAVSVYNSILGETVADAVQDCSNATVLANTLVFDGGCGAPIIGAIAFLPLDTGANGTSILPLDASATSVIDVAEEDWLDETVLGFDLDGDGDTNDEFRLGLEQSGKPRTISFNADLGAVEYVCGDPGLYYPMTGGELTSALGCANADGVDSTVELLAGTYTLAAAHNSDGAMGGNGLPRIVDDGDLIINGYQSSIVRDPDAGDDFRILFVDTDLDTVVLHDVAIESGRLSAGSNRGAGILNRGNLQLHRSVVRDNSTHGLTGRGGGIHNEGNLLLSRSLIHRNATFDAGAVGGGLNNEGSGVAILVNSTVTGNLAASSTGGGIRSDGDGTLLLLVNSTIAYNDADAAANEISVFDGTVLSYNSLVATAGSHACEGGGSLAYLVENGMASDASCGATLTADPQLGALNEEVFVPFYPLSGDNVDTVDFGNSAWLDEGTVGFDLNGDGDVVDDLSGETDQAGEARVLCGDVDLGAAEYAPCDASYSIGGTVTNLAAGNNVDLSLNGIVTLNVGSNGAFTFPGAIGYGDSYSVTVTTQPTTPNQTCTVGNGSGRVANANVTNVFISCMVTEYPIGGSVTGLASGSTLVLQNNGGDDLTITADGAFVFDDGVADEAGYAVTVSQQPTDPSQLCTVSQGSGTVAGGAVTDVLVTCAANGIDLVASITDGTEVLDGGETLNYAITISNQGPVDAVGVAVQSLLGEALADASWTCTAGAGASCPASGDGDIDVLVDLDAGAQVEFTLSADVPADFVGVIETSVVATAPEGLVDAAPEDNAATDRSATNFMFGDGFE